MLGRFNPFRKAEPAPEPAPAAVDLKKLREQMRNLLQNDFASTTDLQELRVRLRQFNEFVDHHMLTIDAMPAAMELVLEKKPSLVTRHIDHDHEGLIAKVREMVADWKRFKDEYEAQKSKTTAAVERG